MAKNLLIVESPAKSKTIEKYLGPDYKVLASYGHVRDLPSKNGSVDVKNDFAMKYEWIDRNIGHTKDLIRYARQAETIYLATDLDREGEAISWHISEILKEEGILKDKKICRITFSEITPKAVKDAVANPRQLLMPLVDAQQTRRALDYLVGFNLSPVLWRKVQKGLSAGRVQSPALRLIVEREEEIENFKPQEYWSIIGKMCDRYSSGAQDVFQAKLYRYKGTKVEQFTFTNESDAMEAKNSLKKAAQQADNQLKVVNVINREKKRRPAAPFTTSTLQQEASRKLGFSTSKTMQLAQSLYEGVNLGGEQVGIITYMRTDSVNLSQDALNDIRSMIAGKYGNEMLPASPNIFASKSKNAQEAHEAIRPSSVKRHPAEIAKYLDEGQRRLYELIWKRTVACQMADAKLATTTVEIEVPNVDSLFRASGTVVIFPGFLSVYEEGRDAKADDDDDSRKLPNLAIGDKISLVDILADQHFTEPPPRFNEATIVKSLEEFGIGRPSTYAAIIQVLLNREYVRLDSKRFTPTDIGRAVSHFLTAHFPKYVDYQFTAQLEDDLDAISRGETPWLPTMQAFWGPFKKLVEEAGEIPRDEAQGARILGTDPDSGKPVGVRIGRYGPMAFKGDPANKEVKLEFASLEKDQHLNSITLEEALRLFQWPRKLGEYEGVAVLANRGRYGPYVVMDKLIASLPDGDDPVTISLERAVELLVAKKYLQDNRNIADLGGGIKVLNGNYGPYVTDGKRNASIPKGTDPKSVTKEEAIRLMDEREANKGKGGGGFKKGKKPFKKGGGKFSKGKDKSDTESELDDLPM